MAEVRIKVQSAPGAQTPLSGDELAGVLRAAAARDERAWGRLVHLYSKRVFALAKSRCGNSDVAEEITQSVFATVATKLSSGGYSELGKFEPWLFRVTMNRLRDETRRIKRHAAPTDPETLASLSFDQRSGASSAQEPALTSSLVRLRVAMADLHPADREIIELRHHGGLSFKQLAELLDEPLGTLLARHHRALKKLHAMLNGSPSNAKDSERLT